MGFGPAQGGGGSGGGATGSDGSAASPAVRGTDADSGIYWTDSGRETALVRDGTPVLRITAGPGVALTGAVSLEGGLVNSSLANFTGGTLTYRAVQEAVTAGTGSPRILTLSDCGSSFNNTGTTVKAGFELGNLAGIFQDGYFYVFQVTDADGMRIQATGSDTIRIGDQVSAAGGYVESARVGSTLILAAVAGSNTWVAQQVTGTWRFDSTTSAGFAYTPTAWTSVAISHTWDADADVSETAYARQDGAEVFYRVKITMTGAPPAANLVITSLGVPGGGTLSVDESAMLGLYSAQEQPVGRGAYDDDSTGDGVLYPFYSLTNNNFPIYYLATGYTFVTQTAPITWATGDDIVVEFQATAL